MISKLKTYHIILLGCLLGSLLILNSNHINRHKATMKLNKEKTDLFNSIISKRRLEEQNLVTQEDGEVIYLTTEVCSKSSDDLKEYYKTGVLEKIGLNRDPIKSDKNNYIQALLDLITGFIEDDNNSESNNQSGNNLNSDPDSVPDSDPDSVPSPGGRRRLLELDKNTKENIKKYSNRIIPSVAFLAIGLLCIIGWIFCCFCTCCNCCCCCCCKKAGCKIPCFIFTYFFYAGVVSVCIYGFTQTNKIFTGIANTECSFLKFFDDILDGEEKETRPKWIGINGVSEMLNSIDDEIQEMEESNLNAQLNYYMSEINDKREEFKPELRNVHKNFYEYNENFEEMGPKAEYCVEYKSEEDIKIFYLENELKLQGKYVLDIVPLFGKYESESGQFTKLISGWYTEINTIDEEASESLGQAQSNFEQLLNENLGTIKDGLKDGKKALEKLRKPFNNVYDTISDAIYDSSLLIDDYGKLTVKAVFGVLGIMNIGLAIFVLLICMFSGQSCADCCCCRCICKCATHILWNVLALFMIIAFIIGSLLSLFGLIGADMVEVLSFVVSAENFAKNNNAILLDQLGEGRSILEECFTGTGDLSHAFNFDNVGNNFNVLRTKKAEIQEYIDTFNNLAMKYPAYNFLYSSLKNKTEFINDTCLISVSEIEPESSVASIASLSEIIDSLNNEIGNTHEKWDEENGDINYICDAEHASQEGIPIPNKLHPWACEPSYRKWMTDISSPSKIKKYAKVVTDIINLLKYANGTKGDNYQNYYDILNELKSKYKVYLDTYLNVLNFFSRVIGNLINAIEEAIGDDSNTNTFSFLNGSFIQIDLKILLKYLKESLGKDLYTVGICLVAVGFSLILSISSTILLIIIINVVLDKNKKLADQTSLAQDFVPDNNGKTIRYANAIDQKPF